MCLLLYFRMLRCFGNWKSNKIRDVQELWLNHFVIFEQDTEPLCFYFLIYEKIVHISLGHCMKWACVHTGPRTGPDTHMGLTFGARLTFGQIESWEIWGLLKRPLWQLWNHDMEVKVPIFEIFNVKHFSNPCPKMQNYICTLEYILAKKSHRNPWIHHV